MKPDHTRLPPTSNLQPPSSIPQDSCHLDRAGGHDDAHDGEDGEEGGNHHQQRITIAPLHDDEFGGGAGIGGPKYFVCVGNLASDSVFSLVLLVVSPWGFAIPAKLD